MKGCTKRMWWIACVVILSSFITRDASGQKIDQGQNINLDRYHNPTDQDRIINLDETDVRKDDEDNGTEKTEKKDEIFNTPEIFEENTGVFNFNLGPFSNLPLSSISSIDNPGPDPDAPIDSNLFVFIFVGVAYGLYKYRSYIKIICKS